MLFGTYANLYPVFSPLASVESIVHGSSLFGVFAFSSSNVRGNPWVGLALRYSPNATFRVRNEPTAEDSYAGRGNLSTGKNQVTANNAIPAYDSARPALAIVRPRISPLARRICTLAICPSKTPTNGLSMSANEIVLLKAGTPKRILETPKGKIIPRIKLAMAFPLVLFFIYGLGPGRPLISLAKI